jgi:hypothetical protein
MVIIWTGLESIFKLKNMRHCMLPYFLKLQVKKVEWCKCGAKFEKLKYNYLIFSILMFLV